MSKRFKNIEIHETLREILSGLRHQNVFFVKVFLSSPSYNVDSTFDGRYKRQMNVNTTLCAYWVVFSYNS